MNKQQWIEFEQRDKFYKSQRQGTDEFGALWLKVNNAVVQNPTISELFDFSQQQVRSLVSLTILETLRAASNHHDEGGRR